MFEYFALTANADPTLTQFPSFVTRNFHNLANNFATIDNFYDSGVVSMDGWQVVHRCTR